MLLSGSKNPIQYALDKLAALHDLTDITGKTEYIRAAVKIVAGISSDIERELFCTTLSRQTDVAAETVRREVAREHARRMRTARTTQIERENAELHPMTDSVNPERAQNQRAAAAEEGIIAILAHSPDLAPALTERSPQFVTAFNQRVYDFFIQKIGEGVAPESILSAHFSPPEVAKIMQIINTRLLGEDTAAQLDDYVSLLQAEAQKHKDPGAMTPEQLKEMIQSRKGN